MIGVDGGVIRIEGKSMDLLKETLGLCFSVRKQVFGNNPMKLAAFDAGLRMILDGSFDECVATSLTFKSEEDLAEWIKNRKGNENG